MLIVISHTNADFDSLACMYAITRIYPMAVPVLTGSPEPNVKEFLEDYPHYAPKKERQINLDQVTDIIVVDASRCNRLANFESLVKRITPLLLIDHHPIQDIDIPAKEIMAEPTGAAITLLVEMLIQKGIQLNPQEASLMALALYEDTGQFTYSRTKSSDFQMMAHLMQCGADLSFINQYLQNELNSEQFSLLFQLSHQIEKKEIKGIEITIAVGTHPTYLADLSVITQKLKKVFHLPILFVLVSMGKRMYMVARSDEGTIDCSRITEFWDGGGHPTAASASMPAESKIDEIKSKIHDLVELQFTQSYAVKHIMSSPVETVCEDTTIMEAKTIIMQYHHNSLIVVNPHGKLTGIISKEDIDRAIHHHLQNATVTDFTATDIITVTPETTQNNFKNLIAKTYQRKFPVLQNGNLVGIVTANDLLNNYVSGFSQTVDISHRFKYSIDTISPIMHNQLEEPVLQLLEQIGQLAQENNAKAFLVGGVVRDLLMGYPIEDYDIVIEGDAGKLSHAFTQRYGGRATVYSRFHTATLITAGHIKIDLASARIESYEHPAALPTVQKSILKHDLYRRDFSINTLAVSLEPEDFGRLIDFFSGRRDLSMGIVRILHNLSFIEDPTRIIRAVRFEQRLNFKISDQSLRLIQSAIKHKVIKKVSIQRIQEEFLIILNEKNPLKPLLRLHDLGVLQQFPISLNFDPDTMKLLEHINSFVQWYRMVYKNRKTAPWLVYLFGILHGLKKELIPQFFNTFTYPDKHQNLFHSTIRAIPVLKEHLSKSEIPNSRVYFLLNSFPDESLLFFLGYFEDLVIRRNILYYMTELTFVHQQINGNDLLKLNLKPGPMIRHLLDEVLKARLDHLISPEQEIEYVKECLKKNDQKIVDNH